MKYNIYLTDGEPFEATSVKVVKNELGTGYRIETMKLGHKVIMFYKTDEITTITQVKE